MSCTHTCTHIYIVISLTCWKSSGCDSRCEKWIQVGVLQVLYPVAGSCHLVEGRVDAQTKLHATSINSWVPSTVVISMHLSPAEIIHRLSLYDSGEIWDTTLLTSTTCNTNNDEHKSSCRSFWTPFYCVFMLSWNCLARETMTVAGASASMDFMLSNFVGWLH